MMILLLSMRTMADIGTSQKKKSLENYKVSFSKKILLTLSLRISEILLTVKDGTQKWEYPIKEVIFYMDLLELERVHLLKPLQLTLNFLFALLIVQIKLMIFISTVS